MFTPYVLLLALVASVQAAALRPVYARAKTGNAAELDPTTVVPCNCGGDAYNYDAETIMGAYRQFSQTTLNASPKGLKKLNPSNWFGKSGTGSSASASEPWMNVELAQGYPFSQTTQTLCILEKRGIQFFPLPGPGGNTFGLYLPRERGQAAIHCGCGMEDPRGRSSSVDLSRRADQSVQVAKPTKTKLMRCPTPPSGLSRSSTQISF